MDRNGPRQGSFFPSKAAAITAVRKLQADGVRNIDFGCMQVNLKYHPKAFENLEEAFDPAANALYAAQLSAKLRRTTKSINRAVAHYHSTTRDRNSPYTKKVMRIWNKERRRIFAEQRERKLAAWRAKREQRKAARQQGLRCANRRPRRQRGRAEHPTPEGRSARKADIRRHRQRALAGHRPKLADPCIITRRAMNGEIHRIIDR
jgi:hypothetical protein